VVGSKQIAKYYDSISRVLSGQSELASITGHPGDTGANREDILVNFINSHTPNKLRAVLGGKVIGLAQKESKQIDCLVCSDIAPRFQFINRSISIVESVGIAISVKSHLDKQGIIDSMDNLASIPSISPVVLRETSSINRGLVNRYSKIAPIRVCFAYSGIHPRTLMGYMIEYYNERLDTIPPENRIQSVIVNGVGMIKTSADGMEIEGGMKVKPHDYYWTTIDERPGVGMAELVHHLTNISTWLNQLHVDFFHYLNESYIEEKPYIELEKYRSDKPTDL
jgi:hypothetical protein